MGTSQGQVWERAHRLTLVVYQAMRTFQKIDRFTNPPATTSSRRKGGANSQ